MKNNIGKYEAQTKKIFPDPKNYIQMLMQL
jgi:hypothetical protein